MKDDSDGDKKQQIHHIQNLYAFNLFCQKRFDDSMQVFAKLGTGKALLPPTGHLISVSSGQICKTDSDLAQILCICFNLKHMATTHYTGLHDKFPQLRHLERKDFALSHWDKHSFCSHDLCLCIAA